MSAVKEWILHDADPDRAALLSRSLRISPVLAQLLLNRGVTDSEQARNFLKAPLSGLHDPSHLPGIEEAAARLRRAVAEGRRICIYGDYDVDGITGTTLLWRCLHLAGARDTSRYIPHRLEEGYGLNVEALRTLHRQGFQVIVTVDCGITSVREAEEARQLGLELIVTDHHAMRSELPRADVLVHPRLPGSTYPFADLSGAGVAFKLAWALCREFDNSRRVGPLFQSFLLESMALVALGTVADVVPLLDENRIFVKHGLLSLREAPSLGLKALLEVTQLDRNRPLNAGHIGFQLAPRINAAGRLGQGILAVELLAAISEQRARDLAQHLNQQNEVRQKIERAIYRQARERIETEYDLDRAAAFVLDDPEWHPGVIGIVASRLLERYGRPVLLISSKEEIAQGSGRSVPGFPLHEALGECADLLVSYGGHAAAAGFKVARQAIPTLKERFCELAEAAFESRPTAPRLYIDAEVPLAALTLGLLKGMDALEPHGFGNRRPVFLTGGLRIVGEPRAVGKGELHLMFAVRQGNGPRFRAIAFNMADRMQELLSGGGECCLAYTPRRNEWQGMVNIDLEVHDFQPGPRAVLSGQGPWD
ncbi:MAG: single-stranded-DNA-specific exonuclease RecJ [Gemmatales bacterium]|nr:single-stranded-DNA-specific exonuclease RecJ [Gemmatales bacterium]MDW8387282.1 single-stranded-DNA-specific exonuclease RecJ [Gemmatales bacterium]